MAEIIILAERRKARQERRATTNVMAMSFALMAPYMVFGAAAFAAIVDASKQAYER
jgi:hypothetical protein